MNLEIGDLIFCKGHGFVSNAIKEISHSAVNHVAIVIEPVNGILIEANNVPVDWTNSEKYRGCEVFSMELLPHEKELIKEYAIKQLNKNYDYHDIVEEFERYMLGIKTNKEDGKAFICSSLVNNCYLSAGISLTDENLPSPGDLYNSKKLKKKGVL